MASLCRKKKYAADLLEKFNMTGCKTTSTPMNLNEKLKNDDDTEATDARSFRSLVGGLIYLTNTRPDISFVGVISRFMHCPSRHHFGTAKRVLRYIFGTLEFGLWYDNISEFKLSGYTDSDWAGCLEDRKSTSGFVFGFGSAVVCWSSKKQATTALSSSEAEYTAATTSACQALWLRRILTDVNMKQKEATEIYCDNQAAISMSKNPSFHERTKHIDIRVHFIRDLVSDGSIILKYCNTNDRYSNKVSP